MDGPLREIDMEPYFNWIPRELNTRADGLSKRVPIRWILSKVAIDMVEAAFPGIEWSFPDLNQIKNHLNKVECSLSSSLLVHPVWPAASWWNKISSFGSRTVALPKADITMNSQIGNIPGPSPWKMQATLLTFS